MKERVIGFGKFLWVMFLWTTMMVILAFSFTLYPFLTEKEGGEIGAISIFLFFLIWAVYFGWRGVKELKAI